MYVKTKKVKSQLLHKIESKSHDHAPPTKLPYMYYNINTFVDISNIYMQSSSDSWWILQIHVNLTKISQNLSVIRPCSWHLYPYPHSCRWRNAASPDTHGHWRGNKMAVILIISSRIIAVNPVLLVKSIASCSSPVMKSL